MILITLILHLFKRATKKLIGRSEGLLIDFDVEGHQKNIQVFTTRPDTIYGVSFMTLAPEHHIVQQITTDKYKSEVLSYLDIISRKTKERGNLMQEIQQVFLRCLRFESDKQ